VELTLENLIERSFRHTCRDDLTWLNGNPNNGWDVALVNMTYGKPLTSLRAQGA